MTEQDYINVRELSTIKSAKSVLCDIVVANSKVIDQERFTMILQTLYEWENKLHSLVEITDAVAVTPEEIKKFYGGGTD
jgi:putative heme iron utilization protein